MIFGWIAIWGCGASGDAHDAGPGISSDGTAADAASSAKGASSTGGSAGSAAGGAGGAVLVADAGADVPYTATADAPTDSSGSKGGICTDAGEPRGTDGPILHFLSRGMNDYKVTSIENVIDPCKVDPATVVGTSLPVNYVADTNTISIGRIGGTPPMPSLGSGMICYNVGVLIRENDSGDGSGCTWHVKVTSTLTLFAGDKFTLKTEYSMSTFMMCKPADIPTGGRCTSTWTWTLEK
jgi:hypothetical protein